MSQNAKIEPIKVARYDNIARIHEIRDDMRDGIENLKKVKAEQERLVQVLEENAAEEFKDLIASCKAQVADYTTQLKTLETRCELLTKVLSGFNEDCAFKQQNTMLINDLLDGLGVFNR